MTLLNFQNGISCFTTVLLQCERTKLLLKALIGGVTIICSSWLGHHFVINFLKTIKLGPYHRPKDTTENTKWIGVFERAVITCLVLGGATSATVFVFAVKTAVMPLRVKNVDDTQAFTEHVIVGTLISYLAALIFGFLGRLFIKVLL